MAELVVVLLVLVALAYVGMPLLRGRGAASAPEEPGVAEATARKRTALGAIVDLESDHVMGKLTDDDFETLRRDYETEALEALRCLDALQAPARDDLEREIATVRARLECPACGAPRRAGARCPRCGDSSPAESQ